MEKILKIIKKISLLIPILIVSLSIKNVHAEEYNIYNYLQYNNYSWTDPNSDYNVQNFSFTAYDNTFIVNNNFTDYIYNVLYDKTNDLYIIGFIAPILPNNSSIICSTSYKYYNYCYYNNNWVQLTNSGFYFTTLSKKDETDYWKKIFYNKTPKVYNNGEFYLTQVNLTGWSNVPSYIKNHKEDFELVYSSTEKVFIDDLELSLKSDTPVEPEEPVEPEVPTLPPYNFDKNKYYVPNYQEGNCVEIIDKDTIRVFENEFSTSYIDYYINSHYISRQGNIDLDYVKNCSNLSFTNIRYYGNDFPEILLITISAITFTIGFPYILYKRFRKR